MYIIEIPKKFARLDGKPFKKMKEDKDGNPSRSVDSEGKLLPATRDTDGNEVFLFQTEDASFLDILGRFLNNLFDIVARKSKENKETKPLKFEDSSFGADVFRAIHVAKNTLELEKAPYEWLLRMLTEHGVDFIGINISALVEPVKAATEREPIRAERRREKRKI